MSESILTPGRAAEPWLLLLSRICFASLFLPDAVRKLMSMDTFAQSLAARGVPAPGLVAWIAALADLFGALGVLIGYRTRAASLLLIAFTIIATALAHRFWEFQGQQQVRESLQFFHNCALVGAFTLLILRGPGRFSIDREETLR
ncbi:MAG TPA: DoxX family protein [Stellaceae bacterium]|nr:DoxX family protein [Stellaceae bacterium]